MIWPKLETILQWKKSGRLRLKDEKFWEGDKKTYDFWLGCVEDRIIKWQEKKHKK